MRESTTRRGFLAAAGGVTVTGLAGCTDDGGAEEPTDEMTETEGMMTEEEMMTETDDGMATEEMTETDGEMATEEAMTNETEEMMTETEGQ